MAKRGIVVSISFLLALGTSLHAETYSWTDEYGTVNFTENKADIPKKYRKRVRQHGDSSVDEGAEKALIKPILPPKTSKTPDASGTAAPKESPALYSGKTYDQWKNELENAETTMMATRSKIEEMDGQIKKGISVRENMKVQIGERNKLMEKYNQLRADYEKLLESAKKAGFIIEMK